MAFTEADTRAKLIDPQIKPSNCLANDKEIKKRGSRVPSNSNILFAICQSITERKSDEFDAVQIEELKSIFEAEESDIYDVLAHLSFNLDIQTRSDRAFAVHYRKYIEKYHSDKVRELLNFILERYEKDGVKEMGSDKLSTLIKLSGIDRNELKRSM